MGNAVCHKSQQYQPLAAGSLDLRTPLGLSPHNNYRYVLNCDSLDPGYMSRMPGWVGLLACDATETPQGEPFSRGNLDLHDQLLSVLLVSPSAEATADGVVGSPDGSTVLTTIKVSNTKYFVPGTLIKLETVPPSTAIVESVGSDSLVVRGITYATVLVGTKITGPPTPDVPFIPEPINHIVQITSTCEAREMVVCTTSRIYLATGTCANWRMLAFGLSGGQAKEPPEFGAIRWQTATLGNYILFTNDYDFVMSWRIGDAPAEGGWSAKYVPELLEVDIRQAGCICSWQGFVFIGDVATSFGKECSRIYWSDFNNPLSWVPGGESLAGYVDLGKTDRVLRMEPLGGVLKVYTTKAIYNCTLVGGDELFKFTEVYRGPDALAFRHALVSIGESHIYLTNRTMVENRLLDNTPTTIEWIHRAAGAIYNGVTPKITGGLPEPSRSFGPLDFRRCNEIVMGYDNSRRQVWVSWPTVTFGNPDVDYGGDLDVDPPILPPLRMTLVLSRLTTQATLVDHAFSAFASFIPDIVAPVREWMLSIGATGCTGENAERIKPLPYEGPCFNRTVPPPPPKYLINKEEDPDLPIDPDSVCARFGNGDIRSACAPCFTPVAFAMGSFRDLTIKQLVPSIRLRERWATDTHTYAYDGYATILQSEHSLLGTSSDKRVRWHNVDYTHVLTGSPLNLHSQIGVGGLADCMSWTDSEPFKIACESELADMGETRQPGGPSYPYYQTGRYVSWRLMVSSDLEDAFNFQPLGGEIDFNRVDLVNDLKSSCQ